jgi:hypothetical protein
VPIRLMTEANEIEMGRNRTTPTAPFRLLQGLTRSTPWQRRDRSIAQTMSRVLQLGATNILWLEPLTVSRTSHYTPKSPRGQAVLWSYCRKSLSLPANLAGVHLRWQSSTIPGTLASHAPQTLKFHQFSPTRQFFAHIAQICGITK